jgi:hypothetical protein
MHLRFATSLLAALIVCALSCGAAFAEGIPMSVKNIGGSPGVGGFLTTKCIFKETKTRCELEYTNESGVEVEIKSKAFEGTEGTTFYSYTVQGCAVGSKMLAAGKCLDKVELKVFPPPERIITATVRVQQVGAPLNTGFASAFLET